MNFLRAYTAPRIEAAVALECFLIAQSWIEVGAMEDARKAANYGAQRLRIALTLADGLI